MTFDKCWDIYPHYQGRSKKAISRAKHAAITTGGLKTFAKDESGNRVPLLLHCSPETLVEACKAQAMTVGSDRQYVPGMQVFMNQGRFEDWSDNERQSLARKYDEREVRRSAHLKVVD